VTTPEQKGGDAAAAKKTAAAAVSTYVVTSPVQMDGERYEIDDEIDLSAAHAAEMAHSVKAKAKAKAQG
jgi:hypothetical protein